MHSWLRHSTALVALLLACGGFGGEALAAVKLKKPLLEEPAAPTEAIQVSAEGGFVGTVIFVRGAQIVAEILGGAREGERMIVYDPSLRRSGKSVVTRALEEGVYLLQPSGGFTAAPGSHLARESEPEAAARVLRANELEPYREFLALFPGSVYRERIAREMFRLVMKSSYPTFPGTVVEGKLELAETVSREVALNGVLIVLDRFIIARTDERGRFRIEGVPKLEQPVAVGLRVKDPKLVMAQPTAVELSADSFQEVQLDLPLKFTPTVLAGQVLDDHGAPLPGAEVWTYPPSMEVLTDLEGTYRVSRRKKQAAEGGVSADEPLFGGEYEVYAYRKGYGVERALVSAESFRDNVVPSIQLSREDVRREDIPGLAVDIKDFVKLHPVATVAPEGSDPRINR